MPELPEVETVRLQLLHKISGQTIARVKVFNDKTVSDTPRTFTQKLKGKSFSYIDRIGKLMIFHFEEDKNLFMLAHLKMTGQFFFVSGKEITGGGHSQAAKDSQNLPNKHTRVAFYFSDDSALYFNDMRKFGYLRLTDGAGVAKAKARFGAEATDPKFNTATFHTRISKKQNPIKATLLDQGLISGLGNIYVDEALFRAKILPSRLSSTVSLSELKDIISASRKIMNHSIKVGGTTFQHFLDTKGNTGNYSNHLKVFGKHGQPCPTCTSPIQKTRVAGRGTHFCAKCQK